MNTVLLLSFTNKSLKCQIPTIAIHLGWKILTTWVFSHSKTSFVLQLLAEAKHNLGTIQDILCKLGMKPHMRLVEIITFSPYHVIFRPKLHQCPFIQILS